MGCFNLRKRIDPNFCPRQGAWKNNMACLPATVCRSYPNIKHPIVLSFFDSTEIPAYFELGNPTTGTRNSFFDGVNHPVCAIAGLTPVSGV